MASMCSTFSGALLLTFVAGCDSENPSPTSMQAPEEKPASARVIAQAEITNPTEFYRNREPLYFPFYNLGISAEDSDLKNLIVTEGENILPSQLIDRDADGSTDTLLVAADMAAAQTRSIRVAIDENAERPELEKLTQAEISRKTGGEWQDKKYIGGTFENVAELTPPPQYTDHFEFIRYEGPGIESDKVGYRIYLDWRNGFDIFGKKTADMVLQDVGQDGYQSYHEDTD